MRAIWLNDIHLEFLDLRQIRRFLDKLSAQPADCILIAGDIAQAPSVADSLLMMESAVPCPIYFVLGNHDFYHGSIRAVRSSISALVGKSSRLRWLNRSGVTRLTEKTVLIGHDGWGDGRLGDFRHSSVILNDFLLIKELAGLNREDLRQQLQSLGDEAAHHFLATVPQALAVAEHVVVLTHVPPFLEASWYDGRYCAPDWLPFFACRAAGDVLKEAMKANPTKRMTVLCGHTHGGGSSKILPNLTAHTGPAEYGRPVIQRIFEWE
jgi:predicted MPP superfamily phosphohydrolase